GRGGGSWVGPAAAGACTGSRQPASAMASAGATLHERVSRHIIAGLHESDPLVEGTRGGGGIGSGAKACYVAIEVRLHHLVAARLGRELHDGGVLQWVVVADIAQAVVGDHLTA